jgi:hypothetical protein
VPIDLRVQGGDKDEEDRAQKRAVLEVIKRIQSRFHRREHILHNQRKYTEWKKSALLHSFTACIDEPEKLKAEAAVIFKTMDVNDSGTIDREELQKAFPQMDSNILDLLWAEIDTDKDECISFEEF